MADERHTRKSYPALAGPGRVSRVRSALLWGAVGGVAFLALAQGYRLVATLGFGTLSLLGIGLVVGVVAALVSYAAEPRLAGLGGNEQR